MPQEEFLFDDFFVSLDEADPGELLEVDLRGRIVPLFVKRGLSLADRGAAKAQAVKTRIKPNGQVEVVSIDDQVFSIELLIRCLKSWPFKYRNGEAVEITRETIKAMFSDGVDTITAAVLQRTQAKQAAREPFLRPSARTSDED